MNNKFSLAEQKERDYFQKVLEASGCTEIMFTPDPYDKVDVYWTYEGKQYVGEIKYRMNYKSTTKCIKDEGAMLEIKKYKALKQRERDEGVIPEYIMMFNDGVGFSFTMKGFKPEWVFEEQKYGKTTMGDTTKIDKYVTYLMYDWAITDFNFQV